MGNLPRRGVWICVNCGKRANQNPFTQTTLTALIAMCDECVLRLNAVSKSRIGKAGSKGSCEYSGCGVYDTLKYVHGLPCGPGMLLCVSHAVAVAYQIEVRGHFGELEFPPAREWIVKLLKDGAK